ncbi:MAG TPA: hypothetical protein VFG94_04410 [Acidimicrobiales bacterium]|nr:hypothetical protein [Acidimicrobiales bacterium]
MLVDRPAARASWPVRALVWAAGVLGLGLGVLVVQQLLAEPAGADTPGLVDGVVGTAEQVVDPVSTALAGDTTAVAGTPRAAPAAVPAPPPVEAPAAPVVEAIEPVMTPVVDAVTPAAEAVTETVAPVVTPAVAPVAEALAPVVTPVVEAVAPVGSHAVEPIAPVLRTVVETVTPVVVPALEVGVTVAAAIVGAIGSVVDPVLGAAPGPWTDRPDLGPSPDGHRATLPIRAGAGPPPVPGPWWLIGGDGNTAGAVLGSTSGAAPGGGTPASGAPPGPPASTVPPAVPNALGGSASGGNAGPSVLVAILAGGLSGLGLARGGVVDDGAARLIGLVHAPGRLPG